MFTRKECSLKIVILFHQNSNITFFSSSMTHTTHTIHCSHPIDVVKTRLQVSGDGTNGARNYKALGIRGTVAIIATEVSGWSGVECSVGEGRVVSCGEV
jgi:hypothetical protein